MSEDAPMLPGNVISFQAYSCRQFPPLTDNLTVLKELGFGDVQLNFGNEHYPQFDQYAVKTQLDRLGLTARSGHFDLFFMGHYPDEVVRIARLYGMELVVAPWLEPKDRPTDREGWSKLGERAGQLAKRFRNEGLRFAWHNHEFEFLPLADGTLPIEHLLVDGVLWAPDLAWVTIAGADVRHWLNKYADRVCVVHVKDVAPTGQNEDESGFADLGTGIVPWRDLWPAAVKAGAELMILEHDNPSDYRRFARVSIDAARQLAATT